MLMLKIYICTIPVSALITVSIDYTPCTYSYTSVSALRIISSYTVHANALLIAFRPILKLKPANILLTPSSRNIIPAACTIFPYLAGISCKRVLIASKGFVIVVADTAATTPDTKFVPAALVAVGTCSASAPRSTTAAACFSSPSFAFACSYTSTYRPAYGASRTAVAPKPAKNPRKPSCASMCFAAPAREV